MKRLLLLFLSGLSLSCTSTPVELPTWEIPQATEAAQYPVGGVPERPVAASATDTTLTFDEAGIRALEAYHEAAVANYAIGVANAEALEAQSRAYNALIEAGKMQREVAILRQELLDKERQDHLIDNLWHRGLIVLIGIGIVL